MAPTPSAVPRASRPLRGKAAMAPTAILNPIGKLFMLWIRSIVVTVCSCCFGVAVAQTERLPITTPMYQCPASLQIGSAIYELKHDNDLREAVYDGPVEEMAALKPEPVPDNDNTLPSFWEYGARSSGRSLYLRCYYQGTEHYVVLKAQGARRCTFTEGMPTVCGE